MADAVNEGDSCAREAEDTAARAAVPLLDEAAIGEANDAAADGAIGALWDRLPPDIRHAIAKRDEEVRDGLAELAEYRELEPFRLRAEQGGQPLAQAVAAYAAIDELVRREPGSGLVHIAQNLGLSSDRAAALFAMLAAQFGAAVQTPARPRQAQPINTFDRRYAGWGHEDNVRPASAASGVVERFRSDARNRHYDLVEPIVNDLLATGVVKRTGDFAADLARAYESACWQHPHVREQLINERSARVEEERKAREKEAVERARSAARSVTGSPPAGATEQVRPDDDDLEAEIRRNLRAANI